MDMDFHEEIYGLLSSASDISTMQQNPSLFDDMMRKTEKYIEKFHDQTFHKVYFQLLPLIVCSSENSEITGGIETHIYNLLKNHQDSASNLEIILKILNEIIRTIPIRDDAVILLPQKVALQLVDMLMGSENVIPLLIECLQLHMKNSKDALLVVMIWQRILKGITENASHKHAARILLEFSEHLEECVPNYYKHREVVRLIQELILADYDQEQEYGLKLLNIVVDRIICGKPASLWQLRVESSEEINLFWSTYLDIIKAIIENRSGSLGQLLQTIFDIGLNGISFESWINVVFTKMLTVKNVAINRMAVEKILEQMKFAEMNPNLLEHLIKSLNDTHMYNPEGYVLPHQNIETFLDCDCAKLLQSMAETDWQPVAFHFWLQQLCNVQRHSPNLQAFPKNLTMTLANKMRSIQNLGLRSLTINVFFDLFSDFLENLKTADEVQLYENLYENGRCCCASAISVLLEKFSTVTEEEITTNTFSKRFYEIIFANYMEEDGHLELLIKTLSNLPKEKHGWLRFLLVFDTPANKLEKAHEFCLSTYDLDLKVLATTLKVDELARELYSKLECKDDELDFVKTQCLNFHVEHFLTVELDVDKWKLSSFHLFIKFVDDFLKDGDCKTVRKISKMLKPSGLMRSCSQERFDVILRQIEIHLDALHSFGFLDEVMTNIMRFVKNAYPWHKPIFAKLIFKFSSKYPFLFERLFHFGIDIGHDVRNLELFWEEPKQGEERIEEIYTFQSGPYKKYAVCFRYWYLQNISGRDDASAIVANLLKFNNELSKQLNGKQDLSVDYRRQMRIAYAICFLISNPSCNKKLTCSDELWKILLEQKHRASVMLLYELSIAINSVNLVKIVQELKKAMIYDEGRQLSVISVAYCYMELRLKSMSSREIDEIVRLLLLLSMNPNSKSRLHAKVAVVLIYDRCTALRKKRNHHSGLLAGLKVSISDEYAILKNSVRFILARIWQEQENYGDTSDCIFYITMEPYDEYWKPDEKVINRIKKTRDLYEKELLFQIM